MNEESRFPKGTDFTLLEKLHSRHSVSGAAHANTHRKELYLHKAWKHSIKLCFLCNFSADKPLLCETQSGGPSVRHQTLCWGGELSQRQSLNLMARCYFRKVGYFTSNLSVSLRFFMMPEASWRRTETPSETTSWTCSRTAGRTILNNWLHPAFDHFVSVWRHTARLRQLIRISDSVTHHATCSLSDWTSSMTCSRRWAAGTVRRRWAQPDANRLWALSSGWVIFFLS